MKFSTRDQCSQLEDALMSVAALGLLEIEGQKLMQKSRELNAAADIVTLSTENMENFLERRLWQQRQKRRICSFGRTLRPLFVNIAVCFTVLCLGACSVLTVSPDARNVLYEFLISQHERYMEVQPDPNMARHFDHMEEYKEAGCQYAPTYIPEGVSLQAVESGMYTKIASYTNGEAKHPFLDFSQSDASIPGQSRLDSENMDRLEKIIIGDSEGILTVKDDYTSISWYIGDTQFLIGTDLSTEEAIRFANGVKKI